MAAISLDPALTRLAQRQLLVKTLQRDTIPTLTLMDPWGSAVAVGAKKKETRSWSAPQRYWNGPIAIHISGSLTLEAKAICSDASFREVLEKACYSQNPSQQFSWSLPLKHIIALVWLENVERIDGGYVDPQERIFGNYQPGRYAWNFGAVYRLKRPLVATEDLGVWQWTPPESLWIELQEQLDAFQGVNVPAHL